MAENVDALFEYPAAAPDPGKDRCIKIYFNIIFKLKRDQIRLSCTCKRLALI